jgi:DNA-binding MarR family transcriptional regulator
VKPFPEIAAKHVILLTGTQFLIDSLWAAQFGREIEYRYRAVPYHLIYLLHKYGPVIRHGWFVDEIRDICGSTRPIPNSNEFETVKLSEEAACRVIDETVALGLITVNRPRSDRRYQLYTMTEEQLNKLYGIREGEADVHRITLAQSEDPQNPAAGQTEQNKAWCENIYTVKVLRHDPTYHERRSALEKLKHLASVLIPFATVVAILVMMMFATLAEATIRSGGS